MQQYDPYDAENREKEINFKAHQIYFVLPPDPELLPSNVIIFELVNLSCESTSHDTVLGWGCYPIVNGEFQINEGKFKIPLLRGSCQYECDSFKNIEEIYRRNVDEWLCNLYVEIRKRELVDFKEYESRICFTTRKEKKRTTTEKARKLLFGKFKAQNADDLDDDDNSSDGSFNDSDDSDAEAQEYTDYKNIKYHDYRYAIEMSPATRPNEEEQ